MLFPETDHFWLHLLGLVLAVLEIALTALVLVYMTATVQQRPAWAREGMTEFIIIWLGSILIMSVVMALHRSIYFACGMILILMSSLILVGSILNVYREQHYERQHREKPDHLAYQTDRVVLKQPGRFFYRIITQLMFSTAGIILGNILIHLD